jgi:alkylation response protein AidB-like acyl-CoA dehydrogenase
MGWNAQPTAQVVFEGARVPVDAMLSGADGEGAGFAIAMNALNGGRINIAACSLGGAQAAYGKAVAYLADREAFGITLLDEPTIRFTLADMATTLESSRNLLWRAASALDDNHPDKVELCAMAKRYITDAATTSPTRPCSCTAATATFGSTEWRRSSAIFAYTASSRAPTKSCAW